MLERSYEQQEAEGADVRGRGADAVGDAGGAGVRPRGGRAIARSRRATDDAVDAALRLHAASA